MPDAEGRQGAARADERQEVAAGGVHLRGGKNVGHHLVQKVTSGRRPECDCHGARILLIGAVRVLHVFEEFGWQVERLSCHQPVAAGILGERVLALNGEARLVAWVLAAEDGAGVR